jgi:fumarate reductase subunit C
MKYLEQKPGHFWWTRNARTMIYFIREFSAILILASIIGATSIMFGLIKLTPEQYGNILLPLLYIGLAGALIHSVTWLAAMPKILPFKLNKFQQKIAYIIFLAILIGITLLFNYIAFQKLIILI